MSYILCHNKLTPHHTHTLHTHTQFGKAADALEKSNANEDEYYIYESEPLTNAFVSAPPEYGQFNCAAFIAGIVHGILDGAGFACSVGAHFNEQKSQTVFIVRYVGGAD